MGVTLERVQNKFACIIGELCSEPVILSQFAIWLDLRLAEYKAKGAISLDCSGDNPDPVWLNGHRLPLPKTHSRDRHSGRFGALSPAKPMSQHRDISWSRLSAERGSSEGGPGYDPQGLLGENLPSVEERLSPQDVTVKEEPSDSDRVFPVSLHRHEHADGRMQMQNRKRTSAETIASSHEMYPSESHSPSTPKTRRVSSPEDHSDMNPSNSDPAANQSLMSIISGEMSEQPTETVDLTESDINIIMDYENKEGLSQSRENSRPPFTSPSSSASGSEFTARSEDSINTAPARVWNDRHDAVDSFLYPRVFPERLSARTIRARVVSADQKPSHTVLDIVKAVTTLERWLWNKYKETRNIEEIPAEELDAYLAEFFLILKRPNGQRYGPASISNYRHHLDRFLKDHKYPYSLSKSREFTSSQRALLEARKAGQTHGSTGRYGAIELRSAKMDEAATSRMADAVASRMAEVVSSRMPDAFASKMPETSRISEASTSRMADSLTSRMSEASTSRMAEAITSRMADAMASRMSDPMATRMTDPVASRMAEAAATGHPGNVKMDASFALLMMSAQQENPPFYSDDDSLWWTTVKPVMYPLTYPETLSNKNIRARIPDVVGKPQQTVVDIVTAVGTVERWMWKKYSETRSIEQMHPTDLNRYLTEFYPLLRRPNGKEYDPKSLTNFKSRLDRFLKENHYPCSINKSDMFATSQQAFANKRRAITAKRSQTKGAVPQTPPGDD